MFPILREKSKVNTTECYQLMAKQKKFAKAKWAEILGVSTSGYYTWLQEHESRKQKRETLSQKVISIFASGKGTYGIDRICGILRRDGQPASYPVVKQIMEEKGLKSCHCRRRQRSLTDSRKARTDEYKNLTTGLNITEPFQVLSSDISYIRTGEGFDYLCQIRDVKTNTVLASCQSENMKADSSPTHVKSSLGSLAFSRRNNLPQ